MTPTSLRNLDLNLLVTLDALLKERSVTRAAERLGVSQPAVSATLRRLRRHFGDELLARSGNRYDLTPLAEQLRERTNDALAGVSRVFDATPDFDPANTRRDFSVIVSDYAAAVLGGYLATVLAERAPHARLQLQQQSYTAVENAPESLRPVDGMVLPHGFLSDVPADEIYQDTWVLIASKDNDEIGDAPTLEQARMMPWVITHNQRAAYTSAARQMSVLGVEADIDVVAENFLPVPFLVAGTRRLAILQVQLAHRLADAAGVRVLPCPWDAAPLKEAFWWHPSHRADPAHVWFRRVVVEAGRQVMAHPVDVPQRADAPSREG